MEYLFPFINVFIFWCELYSLLSKWLQKKKKKKKEKKKNAMLMTIKKWPFPAGFNIKTQDGKLPSVVCKYCSRGRLQWFYVRS